MDKANTEAPPVEEEQAEEEIPRTTYELLAEPGVLECYQNLIPLLRDQLMMRGIEGEEIEVAMRPLLGFLGTVGEGQAKA